jgi:hypothetical protein
MLVNTDPELHLFGLQDRPVEEDELVQSVRLDGGRCGEITQSLVQAGRHINLELVECEYVLWLSISRTGYLLACLR